MFQLSSLTRGNKSYQKGMARRGTADIVKYITAMVVMMVCDGLLWLMTLMMEVMESMLSCVLICWNTPSHLSERAVTSDLGNGRNTVSAVLLTRMAKGGGTKGGCENPLKTLIFKSRVSRHFSDIFRAFLVEVVP